MADGQEACRLQGRPAVAGPPDLATPPCPPLPPPQGFMIGDRLLRPAMVKVSFSDSQPPAAAAAAEATDEAAASGDSE